MLRDNWRQTILRPRLNPQLSEGARRDALTKTTDSVFPDLVAENRRIHELIVGGVQVENTVDGETRGALVRLVDWEGEGNDWLAVSQFSVARRTERRPDIVVFLNGLPLVVIELNRTEGKGCRKPTDIPDLFRPNLFLVISDGITARYGSLSANFDRYMTWRTVAGETLVQPHSDFAITTLVRGLPAPRTLLDMLRRFGVLEDENEGAIKKIAGYHRFHTVRKGVDSVLAAREGDGRWRYLAHASLGEVTPHDVPCRPADAWAAPQQPDAGRPHRPKRPRPSASLHLRPMLCTVHRGARPSRQRRRRGRIT